RTVQHNKVFERRSTAIKDATEVIHHALPGIAAHAATAERMHREKRSDLEPEGLLHALGQELPERIGEDGAARERLEGRDLALEQGMLAKLGPAHAERAVAAIGIVLPGELERAHAVAIVAADDG